MIQNTAEHLTRGVSVPTISSGVFSCLSGIFTFFEVYAATIGAVCTVVSLLFMVFFGFMNGRKLDKSADNSKRLNMVDEHLQGMNDELTAKLSKIEKALEITGANNAKTKTKPRKNTKVQGNKVR